MAAPFINVHYTLNRTLSLFISFNKSHTDRIVQCLPLLMLFLCFHAQNYQEVGCHMRVLANSANGNNGGVRVAFLTCNWSVVNWNTTPFPALSSDMEETINRT